MAKPGRLRVIAGSARGHTLAVPPGTHIRPTLDRVREALFSIIGPAIQGARFLDLFAGSGANGIEALSRGAASCTFIDSDARAVACIRDNLVGTRLADKAQVIRATLPEQLPNVLPGEPFDLVFADPPYALNAYTATIRQVAEARVLRPGGRLIVEHESRRDLSESAISPFVFVRMYRYGDSALSVFETESTET